MFLRHPLLFDPEVTKVLLEQDFVWGPRMGQMPTRQNQHPPVLTPLTFFTDLCHPVDVRVKNEPGLERVGVGGQVLVCDVQHLGLRVFIADGELTGLGDRAVVVDVSKR